MFAIKYTDRKAIEAAARTLCLSFTNDPLIRWLRPNASCWKEMTYEVMTWQKRRIKNAAMEGQVLAISGVIKTEHTNGPQAEIIDHASATKVDAMSVDAMAIVYPPCLTWIQAISMSVFGLWSMISNFFSPANDTGGDKKRIKYMMEEHEKRFRQLQDRFGKQIWYIEVIAVDPNRQGFGLGGKIMKAVLKQIGSYPVALECTDRSNVGFYEKFGFRVVLEAELCDGEDAVTLWIMVRE